MKTNILTYIDKDTALHKMNQKKTRALSDLVNQINVILIFLFF